MIAKGQIDQITSNAAQANLTSNVVERVYSEPTVDSDGHDALRLVIVIRPEAVAAIEGGALLDTLLQIQQGLEQAGEERLAIVDYATEAELADAGDQP